MASSLDTTKALIDLRQKVERLGARVRPWNRQLDERGNRRRPLGRVAVERLGHLQADLEQVGLGLLPCRTASGVSPSRNRASPRRRASRSRMLPLKYFPNPSRIGRLSAISHHAATVRLRETRLGTGRDGRERAARRSLWWLAGRETDLQALRGHQSPEPQDARLDGVVPERRPSRHWRCSRAWAVVVPLGNGPGRIEDLAEVVAGLLGVANLE